MRDAVAAIQAALNELVEARRALPEDFAVEIDKVIEQTRVLLESLGGPSETAAQDEPAER
jgi:hypothetical protein